MEAVLSRLQYGKWQIHIPDLPMQRHHLISNTNHTVNLSSWISTWVFNHPKNHLESPTFPGRLWTHLKSIWTTLFEHITCWAHFKHVKVWQMCLSPSSNLEILMLTWIVSMLQCLNLLNLLAFEKCGSSLTAVFLWLIYELIYSAVPL